MRTGEHNSNRKAWVRRVVGVLVASGFCVAQVWAEQVVVDPAWPSVGVGSDGSLAEAQVVEIEIVDAGIEVSMPRALEEVPGPNTPSVTLGFAGVVGTASGFPRPPDTHIAVGPHASASGRVIMVTNNGLQIWDKTGAPMAGPTSLATFLGTATPTLFDPKIVFDQHSGRFFIVALQGSMPNGICTAPSICEAPNINVGFACTTNADCNFVGGDGDCNLNDRCQTNAQCDVVGGDGVCDLTMGGTSNVHIAVSTGNAPSNLTTDWTKLSGSALTSFSGINTWFDYPGIGTDSDSLFITGNMFDTFGTFQGTKIRVFDKSGVTGLLASVYSFVDIDVDADFTPGIFTVQPAHVYGTTNSGDFYLVNRIESGFYRLWQITGDPGAPSIVGNAARVWAAGAFISAGAPQAGTGVTLDTLSARIMNAVYRHGHVWLTLSSDTDGDSKTEAFWAVIATNDGLPASPAITSTGFIDGSDGDEWTFMPSINVNRWQDATIGYSQSFTDQFPEMRYASREQADAPGTFQASVVAATSPGFYDPADPITDPVVPERWGDYSATVVDPNDDQTFWVANEIVNTSGVNTSIWGTFIAQLNPVSTGPGGGFECGPGDHWIDDCPAGTDSFNSEALAGISLGPLLDPGDTLDCNVDLSLILNGPIKIDRSDPLDDSLNFPGVSPADGHPSGPGFDVIDTEIVSMTLTNGAVSLWAGQGPSPFNEDVTLSPSLGTIVERPGNPAFADSFFDVFFEIKLPGPDPIFLYNHPVGDDENALRVQNVISGVPPLNETYVHNTECIPLFDDPIGGTHIANLVSAEHTLAVELVYFTARARRSAVTLSWETESEIDNEGFNMLRSESPDRAFEAVNVNLIPAQGGPAFGAEYKASDDTVQRGKTYYYLLEDIDTSGFSTLHGEDACTLGTDPDCGPLEVRLRPDNEGVKSME